MTRPTDTQLVILNAAAQRDDGNVLPLPGSLRGGAAAKVVAALLKRGLIAGHVTESSVKADAALNTFWRNDDEGRAVLLRITAEGIAAIGIKPQEPDSAPEGATEAPSDDEGQVSSAESASTLKPRKLRDGTKQAQLIAMLRRTEGATIAQIVEATGWQPHTVRGAFAGALKKKLGLEVTSEKVGDERVYRLPPA